MNNHKAYEVNDYSNLEGYNLTGQVLNLLFKNY
jgi:hypothetical protein